MVNTTGALFEEREHDNGVQFLCNFLPFGDNRVVLFNCQVEKVSVFFEREVRSVEKFGEDEQIDVFALELERFVLVPLVIGIEIPGPFALQRVYFNLLHVQ